MTIDHQYPIYQERELHVEPERKVRTGWINIDDCLLKHKFRRAVGDVENKYRKLLQMGDCQPFPPVMGYWKGGRFLILDGAHQFIATLLLGKSKLFVGWLEPVEERGDSDEKR